MYIFKKNMLRLYIKYISILYKLYEYKYNTHTHEFCKKKYMFWMRLIVINHLTALIYIYNKPCFTIIIVKSGLNEGFNDSLMNVCFNDYSCSSN